MDSTTNPIQATQTLIRRILAYVNDTPWADIYASRLNVLGEKAEHPCELAIAGRVKAGKSSFLNALLGDDLALVGTTETTATINFFKYGRPADAAHPVRVVWDDGREEWQTQAFLNSLQGNTKEVLERARHIDHLEYFVDNPILHNITLVDTPGTGALVDEHEERINDYLSTEREALRKKHNDQSILLKEKADAVIVVTGHVPAATDSEIVTRFNSGTSSFNSLGVMTKIDTENVTAEDWRRRCSQYAAMLRSQLNAIVPVSAGVYRAVKRLQETGGLTAMQAKLRRIPDEEGYFDEFVGQSNIFLSEEAGVAEIFEPFGLSLCDRRDLVAGLDWRVFYSLARELYYNDVDTAVAHLVEYSGMEQVRELLERQFFNRSRIIRCAKIVGELHTMLDEIANRRLYEARFESRNRDTYLKIIASASADTDVKAAFKRLVERNVCTTDQYKRYEKELFNLIHDVEALQQSFSGTDKKTEAIVLLEHKTACFTPAEVQELERLFGKLSAAGEPYTQPYVARRQAVWRSRLHRTIDLDARRIIELAIYTYGTLKL